MDFQNSNLYGLDFSMTAKTTLNLDNRLRYGNNDYRFIIRKKFREDIRLSFFDFCFVQGATVISKVRGLITPEIITIKIFGNFLSDALCPTNLLCKFQL